MARNTKANKNHWYPGDWKVKSDTSGAIVMRSECRYTWDNKLVHHSEWDPKHPQLQLKLHSDKISVPDTRFESDDDADLRFEVGDADKL